MPHVTKVSDKSVLQHVNQKLTQPGATSQNSIRASIRNGDVTLTGSIQFEHHRRYIVRAASSVMGVRRVIDQLKVQAQKSKWA